MVQENIKRVLFQTWEGRGSGGGGGVSHFHPCLADVGGFFVRKSGAVQARTFHYHTKNALHETLPGSIGGGGGYLHNIPLPLLSKHALFYILQQREIYFL